MEQAWFEMADVRKRFFADAVWIPLRALNDIEKNGKWGYVGYKAEFFGAKTIAFPTRDKELFKKLSWSDLIGSDHSGHIQDEQYVSSDIYQDYGSKLFGLHLVLSQRGNLIEFPEWHLHQDFVITLGLKREKDIWVRPDEDYIDIAKLHRRGDGSPYLLEVRATHLRDYLCARKMMLYISSFRSRDEIRENSSGITWPGNSFKENNDTDRLECQVIEIHEGSMIYGGKTAVFHVARTDVDKEKDVPTFGLPTDGNVSSKSWVKEHTGRKLYRVLGELRRNEWVESSAKSPIVIGDEVPPTVFFITDGEGKQETRETLLDGGRWLWFRPEVMSELISHRGGFLGWYTKDTGGIRCSPDYSVHFGINVLGLINVYAKDIALLPDWQQRIWAGYNIAPEGKVCAELLASQVDAQPASTQAPEAFLSEGLDQLNNVSKRYLGIAIIKTHHETSRLLAEIHRFRCTDKKGLLSLAKDLSRLTTDSLDIQSIRKITPSQKDKKLGSLKSLEFLLATKVGAEHAKFLMGPLFWTYELRLADAHIGSSDVKSTLDSLGIDEKSPYVAQGFQLLNVFVDSIYGICKALASERSPKSVNRTPSGSP